MVYKKYIRRGDRVYGPYVYHSRRENGQVITEYRGKGSRKYFKLFLFILVGIFVLVGMYNLFSHLNFSNMTGFASLQMATNYRPGEIVDGVLRLSLLEGELIPENSSVVVDIAGEEKTYPLKDLISGNSAEGNYYVKDSSISGIGSGYGVSGTKYSNPEVDFKIKVVNAEKISEEKTETSSSELNNSGTEISTNQSEEVITENNETPTESSSGNSENTTENSASSNSENSETPAENSEVPPTNPSPPTEENKITETEITEIPTETSPSSISETTESSTETSSSESSSSENLESSSSETTETSSTPITGSVINFLTGFATLDFAQSEINGITDGKVIYGGNAEYKIPDGKSAVLVEGSVSSEGEKIEDSNIKIENKNNLAVVSTNYRKSESGFGENYLGDEKIYYNINLSKLDLTAKEGRMNVKIVFGDSVILETNSDLAVSEEELNSSVENISAKPFVLENPSVYDLTDDEIKLLIKKAGTISVNTTKSELLNGRLVVKYELGDYWTEFSYDYNGKISEDELNKIELERKYWLKNLARELSKNISETENVGELISGYNLNESNDFKIRLKNETKEIVKESIGDSEENLIQETENQTIEQNISEVIENKSVEQNITEVIIEENKTQISGENSSEVTENINSTNVIENSSTENSEKDKEDKNKTSGAGITGQVISNSNSELKLPKLFENIRNFFENLF